MSASVEEAANAHSHLSANTPKTKITPAEGYGMMKAGAWDPVGVVKSHPAQTDSNTLHHRPKRKS